MSKKNRWIVWLIAILLIGQPLVSEAATAPSFESYEPMAENDQFVLYVNEDTLAFKLFNKQTDYVWSSSLENMEEYRLNNSWQDFVESPLTIEYLNAQEKSRRESSATGARIKLTETEDGFKALISFRAKIKMTLNVSLTERGISITIPEDLIVEPKNAKLKNMYVYPFLGATKEDDTPGYMFIPDGSGAIIDYEDQAVAMRTAYEAPIFGSDLGLAPLSSKQDFNPAEQATVPVYGMVHGTENGLISIVDRGAEYGSIEASKAGLSTEFNWVTGKYTYRAEYKQPTSQRDTKAIVRHQKTRNPLDLKLEIVALSGAEASYTGMAKAYQRHLVESNRLQKSEADSLMRLEFLGAEMKKGLFFDSVIVMTPIEKLQAFQNRLAKENLDRYLVAYDGWTEGGLHKSYKGNIDYEKKLGDRDELKRVTDSFKQKNVPFFMISDFGKVTDEPKKIDHEAFAQQINKKEIESKSMGESLYRLTYKGMNELANVHTSVYEDMDVAALALKTVGHELYSTHQKNSQENRTKAIEATNVLLDTFSQNERELALYQPNAYAFANADYYFDIPMSSSNYSYVTQSVPFLQIVLKGYIPYYAPYSNLSSSQTKDLLNLIEYGAFPSFYLTAENPLALKKTESRNLFSSEFDLWESEMVKKYEALETLDGLTKDTTIKSHESLGSVKKVTYSNGVIVYVNYSNKNETVDDVTIPAEQYVIQGGE